MVAGSTLEFALLGLLRQTAQSGYDLRKIFANTPMRHFSDSPGSIYPALRRLESRGWIIAKPASGDARKRQAYRVSPAGKAALLGWLRRDVLRDDVIHNPDELMLRFAFHGENLERADTLKFLTQMQFALEAYLKELRHYFDTFGPAIGSITGRLAFESGIHLYEARLAWVRRTRKELERQS